MWSASLNAAFLWQQAQDRVQEWQASGEENLLIWDDSILEKPESRDAEALCPVRSSAAPGPAPPPPEAVEPLSPTPQVRVALRHRGIQRLGRHGRHGFDRGFAGGPFLGERLALELQFVRRWPKGYVPEAEVGTG